MLKQAWGRVIRAWIKSLFPKPGAPGSSLALALALAVINTLDHRARRESARADEVFVWLKEGEEGEE